MLLPLPAKTRRLNRILGRTKLEIEQVEAALTSKAADLTTLQVAHDGVRAREEDLVSGVADLTHAHQWTSNAGDLKGRRHLLLARAKIQARLAFVGNLIAPSGDEAFSGLAGH